MKRIALIRNSYSYDVGGAEKFPINLGSILIKNGFEPLILSSNSKTLKMAKESGLKAIKSHWWSFQNFSGKKVLLFPLYILWEIYLTIWYWFFGIKNKVDVFHPQSRDDFIAATFAAKISGKKVVWTDHADLKHIYMNNSKWYKNPIGKLVYFTSKLADSIVIESYSEKSLIEKSLQTKVPENYIVIHLGVIDSYKPKNRKSSQTVFVSTSRLVRDKGIEELIKAYKLISNKDTKLLICGDGPKSEYFKTQVDDTNSIEFLGHVDDINNVLQNVDILVHPTYHEGFGLSLVEAEMFALPIIASNVGSIPEIVKDGVSGLLIPSRNVDELAKAMNTLASDQELRTSMGKAGREIFLEKFQFDKIVKVKFIPLYEK